MADLLSPQTMVGRDSPRARNVHSWEQQRQLEETIRDLVCLAVRRAEFERYQQGYEDGKGKTVN